MALTPRNIAGRLVGDGTKNLSAYPADTGDLNATFVAFTGALTLNDFGLYGSSSSYRMGAALAAGEDQVDYTMDLAVGDLSGAVVYGSGPNVGQDAGSGSYNALELHYRGGTGESPRFALENTVGGTNTELATVPTANPTVITGLTASTATNVLTVTAISGGTLAVGDHVSMAGANNAFPLNVFILALGTGTGGTGTYILNKTVGSFGPYSGPNDIRIKHVFTVTLQIRGTAGAYTATVLAGRKGQTPTAIMTNVAVPSLVMVGRYLGLRKFATTENGGADKAIYPIAASASVYSSAPTLAISAPTLAANGTNAATVTSPVATNGTAPYSYQFQRAMVTAGTTGTFANVGTASTTRTLNDSGLSSGAMYAYRVIATDSAGTPATATSVETRYTNPTATASPGFTVATNPPSMALAQGQALTLAVTLAPVGGYTGTDMLSVTGLPTGVTAAFNPTAIANGAGTSVLTLTAAGNAITGSIEVLVVGSDGTTSASAPVLLQVNPPSGVVYPNVANILDTDLITITRGGTTDQVLASVLKAYLI